MLLYTHTACLAHDPGPGHPECPARLEAVLHAVRAAFPALEWRQAPEATRDALLRVENMIGMAGANLPPKVARSQIASAIAAPIPPMATRAPRQPIAATRAALVSRGLMRAVRVSWTTRPLGEAGCQSPAGLGMTDQMA